MKKLILTILTGLTLTSSVAVAQQAGDLSDLPRDDVQQVTLLLSGIHDLGSEAQLKAVPNAHRIVKTLAEGQHGFVRDRALAAMGRFWPSGDVFLMYAGVIAAADTPEGTRHRVVLLLANSFGDRAIPVLQPLLDADELQLRVTAVQALGSIGSDSAVSTIHASVDGDEPTVLVEAIDRATRVLR